MRQRGILVRDRNRDPGCTGCVRITIGTDVQTDVAIRAVAEVLTEIGWEAQAVKAPDAQESGARA
jgi:histidinol-phosphate/aromatic aminotransferase/cobyric acid decarboxylase-like protein